MVTVTCHRTVLITFTKMERPAEIQRMLLEVGGALNCIRVANSALANDRP